MNFCFIKTVLQTYHLKWPADTVLPHVPACAFWLRKFFFPLWPWSPEGSCAKLTVAQCDGSAYILPSALLPLLPVKDDTRQLCAILSLLFMGGGRGAVIKLIGRILSANLWKAVALSDQCKQYWDLLMLQNCHWRSKVVVSILSVTLGSPRTFWIFLEWTNSTGREVLVNSCHFQ